MKWHISSAQNLLSYQMKPRPVVWKLTISHRNVSAKIELTNPKIFWVKYRYPHNTKFTSVRPKQLFYQLKSTTGNFAWDLELHLWFFYFILQCNKSSFQRKNQRKEKWSAYRQMQYIYIYIYIYYFWSRNIINIFGNHLGM